MGESYRKSAVQLAGLGILALTMAGCASTSGSGPSGSQSLSDKMANLLSFNTTNPPPVVAVAESTKVDCPVIEVQDGTAAARFYAGGNTNEHVRYQFDIGETARECRVEGKNILIKVGVSGRALLGPAGSPGTYSVPVRIAIRDDNTGKAIVSKAYEVRATIASVAAGSAEYSVVSEPLSVPFLREQADQDYTILVGFDTAGHVAAPKKKKHRK